MIIRLIRNLNTRIKAGPMSVSPLDDNPYADWTAPLVTADRDQYSLICNTLSAFSSDEAHDYRHPREAFTRMR